MSAICTYSLLGWHVIGGYTKQTTTNAQTTTTFQTTKAGNNQESRFDGWVQTIYITTRDQTTATIQSAKGRQQSEEPRFDLWVRTEQITTSAQSTTPLNQQWPPATSTVASTAAL